MDTIKKIQEGMQQLDNIQKIQTRLKQFKSNLSKTITSAGYIIGIILGIIGLIILILEGLRYYKIFQISRWPIMHDAGEVQDSYMETGSDGVTYSVFIVSTSFYSLYYRTRVSFTYEVDGKKYLSRYLSYYEPWYTNPTEAKAELDHFRPGTKVNIRINPKNPAEAYIENRRYTNYLHLGFGFVLFIVGIFIIYKSLK